MNNHNLPQQVVDGLHGLPFSKVIEFWNGMEEIGRKEGNLEGVIRSLCLCDLFYLLVRACKRADMLHPWVYARVRDVEREPDGMLDIWSREHFKDLADDTDILTENRGWIKHGDLVVGDRVFSPSGKPVDVQWVTEQYTTSKCYRLTFSDGSKLVAGAGHRWRVFKKVKHRIANSNQRKIEFIERDVSTEDMLTKGRWDVGIADPIQYPVKDLRVHPYVLGAWIGDGHSAGSRITGIDEEIFDRIESLGYRLSHPRNISRNVYGLAPLLRSLGVLNAKKIPDEYMRSSVNQRMELLRGLMDTDGHCNKKGTATFTNSNENIANQVYDLAAGLALQPHIRKYSFKSDAAKAINGRYWFWTVSFQAHKERNPFHLQRKANRAINSTRYYGNRTLSKIERIESVPTRCIQVDGGLYVAGRQLVPTRNSTTITFGKSIQDILIDPETTIGIFSHTRPIAKAFLRMIMRELEANEVLHQAFPDVLWGKETRLSPKWSEDDGIIIRRKSNPNEATIEAWGLVDGQPTSKHFKVLLYDDIVVQASVTTPEMIDKTRTALEQSYNLIRTDGGVKRFAGTRWHFNDAYKTIMDRGTAIPRIHPGRIGGTEDGEPVLWSEEIHMQKRRDMGPYTYAAQILLDPKADSLQGFKREWLRYYTQMNGKTNNYILVDAASSKRKGSDYTSMWVIGLATDGNYYALDIIRDRLSLTERADRLFDLHRKWKPKQVRYERYGLMADIEHMKTKMEKDTYRFDITEVGGITRKQDRIGRLIPIFEQGKFYLPQTMHKTNHEKVVVDLVRSFIEEEYSPFPVGIHDDMLDALARIQEPEIPLVWPQEEVIRPSVFTKVLHRGWR